MSYVERIVNDIKILKPVPGIMLKFIAAVEDPGSSISDISEIIKYDHSLTANLLKVCNSAYFGLPEEVDSVHKAIMYMGLEQVVEIALINSFSENFKCMQEGYGLEENVLWKASVVSALIASELAEKKYLKNNHFIFTAALLKDIGKVILSQYVADGFKNIMNLVRQERMSFGEAEKKVLGIDHAELGGLVAEKWGFGSAMINIIRHHHTPDEAGEVSSEASVVHIADMVCMMMGIGIGSDGLAYRFQEGVIREMGYVETDLMDIVTGIHEKIKKVDEMLDDQE